MITFEEENDLELILGGRPWFFRRQLVVFDKLLHSTEKNKIQLLISSFWVKIGPCPSKFDRKDLIHAIRSTFRGILR